jgi:hypothetical protein
MDKPYYVPKNEREAAIIERAQRNLTYDRLMNQELYLSEEDFHRVHPNAAYDPLNHPLGDLSKAHNANPDVAPTERSTYDKVMTVALVAVLIYAALCYMASSSPSDFLRLLFGSWV